MKLNEIKPKDLRPADLGPKLIFMGWNNDNGSDKIWALIQLRDSEERHPFYHPTHPASMDHLKYYDFLAVWGKRGKKLQSKIVGYDYNMDEDYFVGGYSDFHWKIKDKIAKGYESIPLDKAESFCPGIKDFLKV